MANDHQPKLQRLPAVLDRIGVSRAQLYRLIETGDFPAGVKLGTRTRAWLASDVTHWIEERVAASKAGGAE